MRGGEDRIMVDWLIEFIVLFELIEGITDASP